MADKQIKKFLILAAAVALSLCGVSAAPEIFSPLAAEDNFISGSPKFIFRSEGACTLKIAEMRDYYSEEDVFFASPVHTADVTGLNTLSADFIFEEGKLYVWYLEAFEGEEPMRSGCGYFMVRKNGLPEKIDYRRHLVNMIFSGSDEYRNSKKEGYSPTGKILVNGVSPTNSELIGILMKMRTAKKRIVRERIR